MTSMPSVLGEQELESWRQRIFSYIYRRVGDADTANDLASATIAKAFEAQLAGKGHRSHFGGWLYRIAHNLIIDHYRLRDRRRRFVSMTPLRGCQR